MPLNKITKKNIVSTAMTVTVADHKPYKMMQILNAFMEFLKCDILGSNSTVLVCKLGRLTPKIKKGGRIVRNPLNGEEKVMPEIATVTLTKRFSPKSQQTRYTEKQLAKIFSERNEDKCWGCDATNAIIRSFFNSIREVSVTKDLQLEIRGFGLFSSKLVEEKLSSNPKTGEIVIVDEHLKPHFKISGNFRNELYEKIKPLNN